jgi:hypothetical protein
VLKYKPRHVMRHAQPRVPQNVKRHQTSLGPRGTQMGRLATEGTTPAGVEHRWLPSLRMHSVSSLNCCAGHAIDAHSTCSTGFARAHSQAVDPSDGSKHRQVCSAIVRFGASCKHHFVIIGVYSQTTFIVFKAGLKCSGRHKDETQHGRMSCIRELPLN